MSTTDSKKNHKHSANNTKDSFDKYPWLAKDDPRRHQTDAEIQNEKIDLKGSALSKKEKSQAYEADTKI